MHPTHWLICAQALVDEILGDESVNLSYVPDVVEPSVEPPPPAIEQTQIRGQRGVKGT